MRIRLVTGHDRGWVGTFDIPPFQTPPDVVIWGDRVFTRSVLPQFADVARDQEYVEAFAYVVVTPPLD
jgi:hypothetical protein